MMQFLRRRILLAITILLCLVSPAVATVDVHERIRGSLVFIETSAYSATGEQISSAATGFVVSQDGYVVTTHHLLRGLDRAIEGSVEITGRIGGKFGLPIPLRVVQLEPTLDLAVLRFPDSGLPLQVVCLQLDRPKVGDRALTSGFPYALDYFSVEGQVDSLFGPIERPFLNRSTVRVMRGQSGSPVYNRDGDVFGVALGSLDGEGEGVGFFVPIAQAASVLQGRHSCNTTRPNGSPANTSPEFDKCVGDSVNSRLQLSFVVEGGARCPGGGCLFQSSSCNRRSSLLRYEAPKGYVLSDYRFESTAANYASNGPIQTEASDEGLRAISILLLCHPPSSPGAAGGWSNGRFFGTVTHTNPIELRLAVEQECEAKLGGR